MEMGLLDGGCGFVEMEAVRTPRAFVLATLPRKTDAKRRDLDTQITDTQIHRYQIHRCVDT